MQNAAIGATNRSYLSMLAQTPGVVGSGDANPQVFGSTISENAYFIDGQDTTDPLTGTWGVRYNFDALEEIEFQTSGFEAEFGRATGGIVNLITKSGGNQFSGTADIRYRGNSFQESGDHYDSSTRETTFENLALTLGGPILRDKLWFFLGYQYTGSERTPDGSVLTREFSGQDFDLKLTWQASQKWRLVAKLAGTPAEIKNQNAFRFVEPEAAAFQKQGIDLVTFEANGMLSDSLMWNTMVGLYRSDVDLRPQSGDLVTAGTLDLASGALSDNFTNQQYTERSRDEIATDLTWFVNGLGGSHEIKGGIQYSGTDARSATCSTGTTGGACSPGSVGYQYQDFFGGPFAQIESETAGTTTYKGALWTGFVQDSWRVGRTVTLKLGLRYDQVSYDNEVGSRIAELDKLQPRIGVAWDISGDGKNLVRANWGQFMDPSTLSLPDYVRQAVEPTSTWYSCQGFMVGVFGLPITSPAECEFWAGAFGWGYSGQGYDPDRDPWGWVLDPANVTGNEPGTIAPGLAPTYAETFSLAYEREVGRRASIEVSYVDKKTKDLYEDTCTSNLPDFSGPTTECSSYVLGNLPQLARDYNAFILKYETRSFDWLTLLASYTYSNSKGSLGLSQGSNEDFDVNPAHFDNRYGYLNDHRQHRFKLNGFFAFKGDWIIAFDTSWSSAFRWEPHANFAWSGQEWQGQQFPAIPYGLYFVEPRGNREGDSAYRTDLQLTKGFSIGGVRLALIGSVYNAFSSENVTGVCTAIQGCGVIFVNGIPTPEFDLGEATSWSLPRSWEIGLRIEF